MKLNLHLRQFLSSTASYILSPAGGKSETLSEGRLDFIDGLRGITMLMVVYWHILVMSLNVTTYTAMTLQLFRMPLFFFVSGFFAWSLRYDASKLKKRLSNRWHRQLVPTVIIFVAFIIFDLLWAANFNNIGECLGNLFRSLGTNALSEFKSGYWFTFVLVEIFCIFAPLNYLLSRSNIGRRTQGLIFLGIALSCTLIEGLFSANYSPESAGWIKKATEIFSLTHLLKYQVFFYLGAAARAFDKAIWQCLSRRISIMAVIALTIAVYYFTPRFHVPLPAFYGAACTGILFSLTLFLAFRNFFTSSRGAAQLLKFIGKNTLPIYLLHYFIIRMMKDMDLPWLISLIKTGAWVEIPLVLLLSMAITLTVLGVDRLLKIKPRIHRIIFSA